MNITTNEQTFFETIIAMKQFSEWRQRMQRDWYVYSTSLRFLQTLVASGRLGVGTPININLAADFKVSDAISVKKLGIDSKGLCVGDVDVSNLVKNTKFTFRQYPIK